MKTLTESGFHSHTRKPPTTAHGTDAPRYSAIHAAESRSRKAADGLRISTARA